MAQTSWPFENIDTSETQFSQWARNIGEGVKSSAGFELEPYADSSGMNVKVKTGQALVRGHYYSSTAEETLTIATADATNPRIDRLVLQLDPSANTIVLAVLTGTPAVTPVAPELTQTDSNVYELPIATVAVAANATSIGPSDVTDTRTMLLGVQDAFALLEEKVDVTNGVVTTASTSLTVVRNITLSTDDPSGGSDGDVWLKYTA